MLSFLKVSFEYAVILEYSCSESKGGYSKQIIHLRMNLAWHVRTQWNPAITNRNNQSISPKCILWSFKTLSLHIYWTQPNPYHSFNPYHKFLGQTFITTSKWLLFSFKNLVVAPLDNYDVHDINYIKKQEALHKIWGLALRTSSVNMNKTAWNS